MERLAHLPTTIPGCIVLVVAGAALIMGIIGWGEFLVAAGVSGGLVSYKPKGEGP